MTTEAKIARKAGSSEPQAAETYPKHEPGSDQALARTADGAGGAARALGAGSFTTFYTWRANGVHTAVRFDHAGINANSRVFVALSEFNSDAQINRFIGAAKMTVSNIAPFNGGFFAWVEISWNTALNVRFDVLVDP
jgi:hypothetical protein